MKILDTARLSLRTLDADDAEIYLRMINEPSYIANINDKGIRTVEGARESLLKGPIDMQQRLGFSLYMVELREDRTPVGLCGLIKRDTLNDVDIGYAFLPDYWGQGYAHEAAAAVVAHAKTDLGLKRLAAITSPLNLSSSKLLEKIGFKFEQLLVLKGETRETRLFGYDY
jgi:RimJ/RimL family protein N-acetyltransferase